MTVIVAIGSFLFMPDVSLDTLKRPSITEACRKQYPETSKFLKPEEKENLLECLKRDTALEPKQFEVKFVWDTLKNPMSWLQIVIYTGYGFRVVMFVRMLILLALSECLCRSTPFLFSFRQSSMLLDIRLPTPNCKQIQFALKWMIILKFIQTHRPTLRPCHMFHDFLRTYVRPLQTQRTVHNAVFSYCHSRVLNVIRNKPQKSSRSWICRYLPRYSWSFSHFAIDAFVGT